MAEVEVRRSRRRTRTIQARVENAYVPEAPEPVSVRWVTNQNHRWGSCSVNAREIRLSHRLRTMPAEMVDSVIIHELADFIEANHGPKFRAIERRYEKLEWANGFLQGASWQPPRD